MYLYLVICKPGGIILVYNGLPRVSRQRAFWGLCILGAVHRNVFGCDHPYVCVFVYVCERDRGERGTGRQQIIAMQKQSARERGVGA